MRHLVASSQCEKKLGASACSLKEIMRLAMGRVSSLVFPVVMGFLSPSDMEALLRMSMPPGVLDDALVRLRKVVKLILLEKKSLIA
jgi:hypothetical protein